MFRKNLPLYFICTGLCIVLSCKKNSSPNIPPPVIPPGPMLEWEFETTPAWMDEFNVDGNPDATKWSYDIGGNGWAIMNCNIIPMD